MSAMSHVAPTPSYDVTDDRITPTAQNTDALDRRRPDGAVVCSEWRTSDGPSDVNHRPRRCGDDAGDPSRSVVRGPDDAMDDDDVFRSKTTTNRCQPCQCQLSDRQVCQSLQIRWFSSDIARAINSLT